jgi:integrase/recombinase XerD
MEIYEEKIKRECTLRGLSSLTQAAYFSSVRDLKSFYPNKDLNSIGAEEVKDFLYDMKERRKLGGRSINRSAAGIKFYFNKALKKPFPIDSIPRFKVTKTIPTILSKEEIKRMIRALRNIKHQTIIMTLYSTGMRQAELRNLKPSDIDSKRMVINVRQGKGNKDRQCLLSKDLLIQLRSYWKQNKDDKSKWLFPISKNSHDPTDTNKKMSHTAVHYVLKNAAKLALIKKNVYPHCMRHSFAVHLLEAGANIRHIQYLLGHESLRTTMKYLYIADIRNMQVTSPLDSLELNKTE